jgi:hypothetical protein
LTPPEVVEALGAILMKAEKELGLTPAPELPAEQRAKRLIDQPDPLPPYLYKALQAAYGTRH